MVCVEVRYFEQRGDQAAELQVEERSGNRQNEGKDAGERPPPPGEWCSSELLCMPAKRCSDFRVEHRIHFKGETGKTGDGPGVGIEILLAYSAGLQMLAEGAVLLNRSAGCKRLVDHLLKEFVIVRLHDFLSPTAPVRLRDLDRFLTRP